MARREKAGVGAGEMRIEYVALSELRRWPRNPKGHALELLDASFARFGFVKPVMLDEGTGRMVAGHGRLEALEKRKAEGKPPPERVLVRGDGEWLVPVQRGVRFSSEAEARAYLLADNRTQELGGWVEEDLAHVLAEVGESGFEGTGYTGEDLEGLLATLSQGAGEGAEKVAVAGYERAKTLGESERKVPPGATWRVLEGEMSGILASFEEASFDALVTDPPYSSGGMYRSDRLSAPSKKYVQTGQEKQYEEFTGDNRDQRAFLAWCTVWLSQAQRILKPGAPVCLFTDWHQLPAMVDALQSGGFIWRGILVWDKTEAARPCSGRFRSQCEYVVWGSNGAMLSKREVPALPGVVRQVVVSDEKYHMTGKPTEVMEAVCRIVEPGGTILDPFFGSGSTGVAALRLGCSVVGIERVPEYAKVARERLKAAEFGLTLRGEKFDEE